MKSTNNIIQLILQLKEFRDNEKFYKAELKSMLDVVKESKSYQAYTEYAKKAGEVNSSLYTKLTAIAVKVYKVTGNKKFFPGLEVKEVTQAKITDPEAVFKFALENRVYLKVDEEAIIKYAKDNAKIDKQTGVLISPLPFVSLWKEPQGTVASDLEKALKVLDG